MSTRVLFILLAALAAVLLLVWVLGSGPSRVAPPSDTAQPQIPPTPTPAPVQRVMLLFAGADGQLHPELREVPLPAEAHERALGEFRARNWARAAEMFRALESDPVARIYLARCDEFLRLPPPESWDAVADLKSK